MPHPVERVAVDRAQAGAGLFGGGAKALDLVRRVQPRIVAEDLAGFQRIADPAGRRLVDQMVDFEQAGVDLLRRLQRIAAIDKQRGALAQHDREPGRAGKAGQPCQPLAARRDIFALMLVGARHDKAVEPARRQFLAQSCDAVGARQPDEILAGEAVAVVGGHLRPQLFEGLRQCRRHRIGDEAMPFGPDFGRRAEHTVDQRLDASGS